MSTTVVVVRVRCGLIFLWSLRLHLTPEVGGVRVWFSEMKLLDVFKDELPQERRRPTTIKGLVVVSLLTPSALCEKSKFWVLGDGWSQGSNFKGLTERHHQEWRLWSYSTQHGKTHQVKTWRGLIDFCGWWCMAVLGWWSEVVVWVIPLTNETSAC